MSTFLQQLVNGLSVGSIYALIALGYTMVYGTLGLINFAHGEVFMIGCYIGLYAAFWLGYDALAAASFSPMSATLVLLLAMASRLQLPLVATGNVHYLESADAPLHDVLTCIRSRVALERAGSLLRTNAEYRFRTPQEMAALFAEWPAALANTLVIAARCQAQLPHGPQQLPKIELPSGVNAAEYLTALCQAALQTRVATATAPAYRETLARELEIISEQQLANYFLVVWDLVRFARQRGILCQGRGSAANSLTAYLLGITPVDPLAREFRHEVVRGAHLPVVLQRARQPVRQRAHHVRRDRAVLLDQAQEHVRRDHHGLHCTPRADAGGARRIRQKRHLAEYLIATEDRDDAHAADGFQHHLDLAIDDHIGVVAALALPADVSIESIFDK